MTTFKTVQQLQGKFKIRTGACPVVLRFHAGSLDVGDAPASNLLNSYGSDIKKLFRILNIMMEY
jgi:hypothetical protein